MLTDIYIEHFTVVDRLHLTLSQGLCVLSGETGAGKSILIDALQLALGRRADPQLIRHGETSATITAMFDVSSAPAAATWLEQHGFYDDHECVLTRTLHRDGRSRSTINGKPCATSLLRELAPQLMLIHGQHDAQILLQRERQQQFLDTLGNHQQWLDPLRHLYDTWRNHQLEIRELTQRAATRDSQLSFWQYQLDELLNHAIQADEWEKLHQEHQQLHHAKELLQHLNAAIDSTIENERASSAQLLHTALEQLRVVERHYPELAGVIELLETAAIHVQEAGDELVERRDRLDLSPERLQQIEQRLTLLHDLARKHHVSPAELPDVVKSLQQQIATLTQSDERILALTNACDALTQEYRKLASELSASRQHVAATVSEKISAAMQRLGMQGGEFAVVCEPVAEPLAPEGQEKLAFWVKTNPGQALQPLAKVVSGGELSRISLALQTLLIEQQAPVSLVFDEVDTGIGGTTAEIVGNLLKTLGERTQVFCITHLPQVAAQAHHHYRVTKSSDAEITKATIEALDATQRIDELARMLSGSKITAHTRQHAADLLTSTIA